MHKLTKIYEGQYLKLYHFKAPRLKELSFTKKSEIPNELLKRIVNQGDKLVPSHRCRTTRGIIYFALEPQPNDVEFVNGEGWEQLYENLVFDKAELPKYWCVNKQAWVIPKNKEEELENKFFNYVDINEKDIPHYLNLLDIEGIKLVATYETYSYGSGLRINAKSQIPLNLWVKLLVSRKFINQTFANHILQIAESCTLDSSTVRETYYRYDINGIPYLWPPIEETHLNREKAQSVFNIPYPVDIVLSNYPKDIILSNYSPLIDSINLYDTDLIKPKNDLLQLSLIKGHNLFAVRLKELESVWIKPDKIGEIFVRNHPTDVLLINPDTNLDDYKIKRIDHIRNKLILKDKIPFKVGYLKEGKLQFIEGLFLKEQDLVYRSKRKQSELSSIKQLIKELEFIPPGLSRDKTPHKLWSADLLKQYNEICSKGWRPKPTIVVYGCEIEIDTPDFVYADLADLYTGQVVQTFNINKSEKIQLYKLLDLTKPERKLNKNKRKLGLSKVLAAFRYLYSEDNLDTLISLLISVLDLPEDKLMQIVSNYQNRK